MNKITILLLLSVVLVGCNSVKRNQKFLAQGNYDKAIELAVKKLQKDKASEKNDAHIVLLEEGFKKASEEDTRRITFLKKENNPATIREIYYLYKGLDNRQELLRPILPLYSETLGRNAKFKLVDYSNDLIQSKKTLVEFLYAEGAAYMKYKTIEDYRTAYNIYCEIDELQYNYRDVTTLKEDAHFYGTNFVYVTLNNRTGQLLPLRLQQDLLDFNTYGLDDFWTEYHNERQNNIEYTYGIALNFNQLNVSPERISDREEQRTKEIITGWKYRKDREGNILKDENGNPLKIDIYETVSAVVRITFQTKAALVGGNVTYRDLIDRKDIDNFPLVTEFVFENAFATYRGDKRALTPEDLQLVNNRFVYFPTNEQMVLNAGEDIKIRLKNILSRNDLP